MNHTKDVTKINLSKEENRIESWCVYAAIVGQNGVESEAEWTVQKVSTHNRVFIQEFR